MKLHLNVPPRCDMRKQHLWRSLQITGSPLACLRQRSIQRLPHKHDLAALELAQSCGDDMHVHVLLAFGPLDLEIVVGAQLGRIVRESRPAPSLGAAGSSTRSQRVLLSPLVIKNPRSRAARQRHLALCQVSS